MLQSNVIQGYFPNGAGRTAPAPVQLANLPRDAGQPLPPVIQRSVEAAFRTSFADVRVHVGPQAPAIGAVAFTHGSNIYFAPGQYDLHSARGQRILWHELTHVAQQKSGRVRNPFGTDLAVVHDRLLEAEAERMSLRPPSPVATPKPIQPKPIQPKPIQPKLIQRAGVVQPLLFYSYPSGKILNSNRTEEELTAAKLVPVTHRGVTVWANALNQAATTAEIDRRFLAGSLSAIPAATDLKQREDSIRPITGDAQLLILKTWDPDTIGRGAGVYVPGKVFYRIGDHGTIHHLTASLINHYWDALYAGFRRITKPDWRYNCADHALAANGTDSVDEDTALATHFEAPDDIVNRDKNWVKDKFETAGTYVYRLGNIAYSHYIKLVVGATHAEVSQKDGDSGVYVKTMTLDQAAEYCTGRRASMMRLYKKK
jgi:hypothetical protein